MAFIPPFDGPSRKEILEILKINDNKSTLESSIINHHFNHALDVFIPGLRTFPTALEDIITESDTEYYNVHDVTLDKLLDMDFIGAFVKKGRLSVLSDGTRIDVDNSVCLYHPGILVVSLTKDDYEELGLQGKPSRFGQKKKPGKYLVDLNITADGFFPGKNLYDRSVRLFRERQHLTFDLLFSWVPHDESISSRSLFAYLKTWGHNVDIYIPQKKLSFIHSCLIPKLTWSAWNGDQENCGFNEFMEWIGFLSCNIDFPRDSPISKCDGNIPLATGQWTGFLSSDLIFAFIKHLTKFVMDSCLPWAAAIIHGFDDVPISWNNEEHGYSTNGDNLCSIVVFPDSSYWMCKGLGSNDFLPNCKPSKSSTTQ